MARKRYKCHKCKKRKAEFIIPELLCGLCWVYWIQEGYVFKSPEERRKLIKADLQIALWDKLPKHIKEKLRDSQVKLAI